MTDHDLQETREMWNQVADDWQIQVGEDGDRNRILNSDPVLWAFAGEVKGRHVLDAGCGNRIPDQETCRLRGERHWR